MGIVINGQIYRGKGGGAGEFGHIMVDPNGPRCDCGRQGCLETLLSDRALVAEAQQKVSADIHNLDDLIASMKAGNQNAALIFTNAGKLLGHQIANLVNLLDPKLIIISGEGHPYGGCVLFCSSQYF